MGAYRESRGVASVICRHWSFWSAALTGHFTPGKEQPVSMCSRGRLGILNGNVHRRMQDGLLGPRKSLIN